MNRLQAHPTATVPVTHASGRYDIHIGVGLCRALGHHLHQTFGDAPRSVAIVTNPKVARHYAAATTASLEAAGFAVQLCVIPDGERFKHLRTVERIWDFCLAQRLERRDVLVALGGGVVGDLVGFAAATYLRGVAFVQVPTTLLAMIDSSVGGKTGFNWREGKNLIGAFHQPALVVADLETLQTLPRREWHAGWHEAIKYGVIRDADLFARLEARLPLSLRRDAPWDWLGEVIADCCRIKADIVARDERETGERKILNFGHTIGHALEAVTRYRRFRHGEAVGLGMIAACQIAAELGWMAAAEAERVQALVRRVGRMPATSGIAVDAVLAALAYDKKVVGGQARFILPSRIGVVQETSAPTPALIRRTLQRLLSEGHP
ncbi:MAG: 3-dehydroquinate synthase [Chloracidobacterium sp.]